MHRLPGETVQYLNESRYCPANKFIHFVQDEFGDVEGGAKIGRMRDWIEARFRQGTSPTYRELSETLETGLIRELLPRYGGRLARLASELKANRATLRKRLKGAQVTD